MSTLTKAELAALGHDWTGWWARNNQLPPEGDWSLWLLLAGRGFGKTRTAVEWQRAMLNTYSRWHVVGRTAADVRDVLIEGESGIMAIYPDHERPTWSPSKRLLTWPNGATATTFSADEPDSLRGPQCEAFIADEIAAWRYPEAWDMLMMGFRLGRQPRGVAMTTPRPIPLLKQMLTDPHVAVTRGTTFDNIDNLAPSYRDQIIGRYEGTRLGRQELYAELLEDAEGALWSRDLLEQTRVSTAPDMSRIVVGVDPEATSGEGSAETGIIVAGLGRDGHGYVLDDRTTRGTPQQWAQAAIAAYSVHHADRLIAEVNQGGEMVELTLRTVNPSVSYKAVRASKGKQARAEPIAALYEQGRVHLVGAFPELEDQLCGWVPGNESPDRLDAMVWALTELMLTGKEPRIRTFW